MADITDHLARKFPVGSAAYTAALANIVGGTRGMQSALELTGKHMATFKANVAGVASQVKEGAGNVLGWDKVNEDFNQRIAKIVESVKSWAIGLGTTLIPWLEKGMDKLAEWGPTIGAIVSWIGAHLVPIIGAVSAWISGTFIPAVQSLAAAFMTNIWPALQMVAGMVVSNLQPAFATLMDLWTNSLLPGLQRAWPWFQKVAIVIGVVTLAVGVLATWLIGHLYPILGFIIGKVVLVTSTMMEWASKVVDFVIAHFGTVVTFFKTLPGMLLAPWVNASTMLLQAGKDLVAGLINGVTSMVGNAVNTVKGLGSSIVSGLKGLLGIASPSKLFHEIGVNITQGLINGINAGKQSSIDAAGKLADAALKKAQDAVTKLKTARDTMATNIAGSFGTNITGFGGQNGAAATAGDITGGMSSRLNALMAFNANLAQLRSMKLRGDLMSQIVNGGDAGMSTAAALAGGGAGAVGQANATQAQIAAITRSIGMGAANAQYGAQIGSAVKTALKDSKIVNEIHVYLDGKEIHRSTVKHAQRHKKRNGTTGLA